jgi:hypothetical protein
MKIEQEGCVADSMYRAGFEKQAGLAGPIPVSKEDEPFRLVTGNVPCLQLGLIRSAKTVSLERKPHGSGIDCVVRTRHANAQK